MGVCSELLFHSLSQLFQHLRHHLLTPRSTFYVGSMQSGNLDLSEFSFHCIERKKESEKERERGREKNITSHSTVENYCVF